MDIEFIQRLDKDLKKAAVNLTQREARYMVKAYYIIQDYRKALGSQKEALSKSGEPNDLVTWFFRQHDILENNIKKALEIYTDRHPVGHWAKKIFGIGPVISAGLIAHIDITKAPTVGHIWRFGGLDSTVEWLGSEKAKKVVKNTLGTTKGPLQEGDVEKVALAVNRKPGNLKGLLQKGGKDGEPLPDTINSLINCVALRPWNEDLKTLCWKAGESFVKVSNNPKDFYGKLYKEYKEEYLLRNSRGDHKERAEELVRTAAPGYKATEGYQYNLKGVLSPGHIHSMARRKAVKIFLAHLHEYWYRLHYGQEPPKPYVIEHLGHTHYIDPPGA